MKRFLENKCHGGAGETLDGETGGRRGVGEQREACYWTMQAGVADAGRQVKGDSGAWGWSLAGP